MRPLTLIFVLLLSTQVVHAGLMSGSIDIASRADQFFRVTPGSPLTGPPFEIPEGAVLPLSALGSFTVGWGDDTNNDATVDLESFSAEFEGVFPAPYRLTGAGSGPGASFSGQLTNIVESGGQLVSADLVLMTTFSLEFMIPGLSANPTLYTKDLSTFTGEVQAGGAALGEVFVSVGETEVFFATGDPDGDPLSGVSFGRTVTAVPEPSTALSLGLLVGLAGIQRRRRKKDRSPLDAAVFLSAAGGG
jgi:hypothetical protein